MFLENYDPLKEQMVQIMDADGNLNEELRPKELTDEVVKELYEKIVFCRLANDRIIKMQRTGRMGTFASVEGQEALQIAAEFAIEKTDWVVPAFRELPAMWAHGVPMENIYLYWRGNEAGGHTPDGVYVLPPSIPVGSQMLHAVGLSWASQMRGEKQIAVSFFGDGATSEGDFHEAMNFSGVFKTPTIHICQNNQFAISTPRSMQTASKTIAQKAIAYGFPGVLVDGNDLFAMYAVMKEAVARARGGQGSTLVEAYTYRLGDHTTSDDAGKYRDKAEVEKWRTKDPIRRLQIYLGKKNLWSEQYETELREKIMIQVDQITANVEATPDQTIDQLFDYTFRELTPPLVEEKAYLKKMLAMKEAAKGGANA